MPRTCTACSHPRRPEIDRALVDDSASFRDIARRYAVSKDALARHKREHLPSKLAQAKQAEEVANADDLLGQVQELRRKALDLLAKAERAGDYRTALAGVKEARNCIETLLEVEGKLDRRPTFNVTLSASWIELRSVIIGALRDHPDAATAVAAALLEAEGVNSHAAD